MSVKRTQRISDAIKACEFGCGNQIEKTENLKFLFFKKVLDGFGRFELEGGNKVGKNGKELSSFIL